MFFFSSFIWVFAIVLFRIVHNVRKQKLCESHQCLPTTRERGRRGVLKFATPFSFVLRAVNAIKNWWGKQLENGFHMYSVLRNKVTSGRHF